MRKLGKEEIKDVGESEKIPHLPFFLIFPIFLNFLNFPIFLFTD